MMTYLGNPREIEMRHRFVFNCSVNIDGIKYERGKEYDLTELEYQKVSRFVTLIKGVK